MVYGEVFGRIGFWIGELSVKVEGVEGEFVVVER